MFSTLPNTNFNFSVTFILSSASSFKLKPSKYLLFGKGLKSCINSFPNKKILDSSKLKAFVGDHSKFDEHGKKFSKIGENTVGKGEIAHY